MVINVGQGIRIDDQLTDLYIHLPAGGIDGTIVTTGNDQILYNKDLTDPSNDIRATRLGTTGADVVIGGAAPPPGPGYVLETTSPTTAVWVPSGSAAITGANVGTSGVGVYRDTVSGTLNFKKLRTTSRMSIVDDLFTNTVLLDVDESNLLLQNIGGTLTIAQGGTGATTIAGVQASLGITKNHSDTVPPSATDDSSLGYTEGSIWVDTATSIFYVCVDATPGAAVWVEEAESEVSSASNVNIGGVGVFKQLVGSNLEFKGVIAGSAMVSVVNDVPTNNIEVDVVPSAISHDSLAGVVANRHVDHSAVSIVAGTALTGGGNITTSRTLNLDITTLGLGTIVDTANDFLLLYDDTDSTHKKIHPSALPLGETNTASNVNSGGVGVFKQKTGTNLEFRGVNAASTRVSVSLDGPNNEIDVDVVEAQVNHDALLNFVANKHVDHSAVNINTGSGLSGGGNITASRTISYDFPSLPLTASVDSSNDFLILYEDATTSYKKVHPGSMPGASGEANTASNVTVGGVGVFKQKTGVNLEFRGVTVGSTKASVTLDAPNNNVVVDVVPANIDHDALLGFVANEHVDHSAVSINSGIGLTGGGDITATRTLALDIPGLIAETVVDPANDLVVIYDASATTHKKVLVQDMPGADGEANTASNVNAGGVGVFKQKTGTNLEFRGVNAASTRVSVSLDGPNNEIDVDVVEAQVDHDALLNFVANEHVDHSAVSITTVANSGLAGGGNITTTRNLVMDVNNLVTESSPDFAADYLPIYDASATATKKILLSKLKDVTYLIQSATTSTSVSSTTYVTVPTMTLTPTVAGTYAFFFSATGQGDSNSTQYRYAIFKNGVQETGTFRSITITNNAQRNLEMTLHTQGVVTVNGSDTVDVRFSVDVATRTFTMFERNFIAIQTAQ